MYSKKTINAYFFKNPGFYAFYIPVMVPYKKIYSLAENAGYKTRETFGPILERGKLFGFGWIGVEIETPRNTSENVVYISADFETYEHKGAYKTLGRAYKKLMKDRPAAKEFYNLYLDDPEKVSPENCRTLIHFR